jgi:hypothetical protein
MDFYTVLPVKPSGHEVRAAFFRQQPAFRHDDATLFCYQIIDIFNNTITLSTAEDIILNSVELQQPIVIAWRSLQIACYNLLR